MFDMISETAPSAGILYIGVVGTYEETWWLIIRTQGISLA